MYKKKIGKTKKKRTPTEAGVLSLILILFFRELVLADAAHRAFEIGGEFFPRGSGRDARFRHTNGGVVNPTAQITYVLFHSLCF